MKTLKNKAYLFMILIFFSANALAVKGGKQKPPANLNMEQQQTVSSPTSIFKNHCRSDFSPTAMPEHGVSLNCKRLV